MKKSNWKVYAAFILLTEAVGGLAGFIIRDGVKAYEALPKPSLTPPSILFPIMWTLLYLLMGIGIARVYIRGRGRERRRALWAYALQLLANFLWSPLFFNLQAFGPAFFWLLLLLGLILWMFVCFRQIDKPAALLQLPYILWVAFAGYLNLGVWMING